MCKKPCAHTLLTLFYIFCFHKDLRSVHTGFAEIQAPHTRQQTWYHSKSLETAPQFCKGQHVNVVLINWFLFCFLSVHDKTSNSNCAPHPWCVPLTHTPLSSNTHSTHPFTKPDQMHLPVHLRLWEARYNKKSCMLITPRPALSIFLNNDTPEDRSLTSPKLRTSWANSFIPSRPSWFVSYM